MILSFSLSLQHKKQEYYIAFPAQFENLANHLLNISPVVVSVPDLAETFSFKSAHTVRNYISYLKQAYLLTGVKKYSPKSKIRITQEKLYAVDTALMNKREDAFAGEKRAPSDFCDNFFHCRYEKEAVTF